MVGTRYGDVKCCLWRKNEIVYSYSGSTDSYPDFVRTWFYFVIPDEAVSNMPISKNCVAYTLENEKYDAYSLLESLIYTRQTPDGIDERCDYTIREYIRLYDNASIGSLIIGTLYICIIFVCMVLAILSLKTLSSLEDDRRRFEILYRPGADMELQKIHTSHFY